jgi:hypothetical protein
MIENYTSFSKPFVIVIAYAHSGKSHACGPTSHQGESGLNRNVVFKKEMSYQCRPHAVVSLGLAPDNGIKPERSKK